MFSKQRTAEPTLGIASMVLLLTFTLVLSQLTSIAVAQDDNQREAPIAGLPKGWLNNMRKRAAHYVEFAKASFTLDEGQVGLFRLELDNRISDQWQVERDLIEDPPAPPSSDDPDAVRRFAEMIDKTYQTMPMNPKRVADWFVDSLAAPAEAQEGRSRFLELCERLDLENNSNITMAENKVKLGRLFKSGRTRTLQESYEGVLLPAWQAKRNEVPQGLLIRPNQQLMTDAVNLADVRDDLPPALPCLLQAQHWDVWPTNNGKTANAKAFELFQEFQFRTWWVLAGEPELYKTVSRAYRNSIVAKAIDDAGLRPQIDALLFELRCRVSASIQD